MTVDDADLQITAAAGIFVDNDATKSQAIQNITGIYFYTLNSSSYGFDLISEKARSLYFPMGKRNTEDEDDSDVYWGAGLKTVFNPTEMDRSYLDDSTIYRESTMLVDLDRVYIGSTPGFRYDPINNVVTDITVTFPDPVTFNSISWISTEPSDSIVYIQVKRLDSLDGVDSVYNKNAIFTNNGTVLNNAQYSSPYGSAWLTPISPTALDYAAQMASRYRVSGSDFPSEYNAVRSVSFQAVLLPSSDLNAAPVLNSISINFTSNTIEGDLVISTEDQWSNYRSQSSILNGIEIDGTEYVTIDIPTGTTPSIGKIKNLIYGTDRAIVEVGNSSETWLNSVKVFLGETLPLTVVQEVSQLSSRLSGYVTNLQKRKNGNIIFLDQDASRIVEVDKNYSIVKIVASEYAYKNTLAIWMPETLTDSELKAELLKAIYNPDIGDNGVLYLVFSHELKAWDDLYSATVDSKVSDDYNPVSSGSVNPALIQMVVQATDVNFSECTIYPVDRGILCIELTETENNYISGNLATEIKVLFNLNPDFEEIQIDSVGTMENQRVAIQSGSCVEFKGKCIAKQGVTRVSIDKPTYSIVYAPIQGCVAFDIDDDEMLYILKKSRPYTYGGDTWTVYDHVEHQSEPWYVKMSSETVWDGWLESTKRHSSVAKEVIDISNFANSTWEPNFYINSIYGYRASIQKKDTFLLMCISGEKNSSNLVPNGVYIFNKATGSSGGKLYGGPEEFEYIFITNDNYYVGTYLMAARFDPLTYNETTDAYGSVYVAVSDLRRTTSINSKSKVVKIDPDLRRITWEWGSKADREDGISNSFALIVNDISPLSYNDTELIVST